jgi:hypothetical protein
VNRGRSHPLMSVARRACQRALNLAPSIAWRSICIWSGGVSSCLALSRLEVMSPLVLMCTLKCQALLIARRLHRCLAGGLVDRGEPAMD